ncbi:hypothetical protein SAMN02745146_2442 [Hymenobacter daecheongensis DSM 21074]|uniref:DUF4397 domain-containing protein n=1 Tax=Hymenobacter daecheongensis DSM 21074 TaxID=1121955 RepID=A0A1M6GY66_9BACT|nr:DUF4397 domain-containing protein [Hymenobacter daecheongensis]SHJ14893.1 hypothetical protein SAMN02745146_2442 [Hymenobacter daecheongensis DSM 21074]
MKHPLRLSIFAAAALLASCTRKNEDLPAPAPAPDQGYVRIVNTLSVGPSATLQQGDIRLVLADKEVGPAAAPGTAAPYQAITVGTYFTKIMLPYPPSLGTNWVQLPQFSVAKNQRYSLFTYGSGFMSTSVRVVPELPALPAAVAGKASVRVLNIAAQATDLRVAEGQPAAPLFAAVAWGAITDYQAVEARAYTLQATRTNGNQAQLFTQTVALQPGKAYTLVLRGSSDPDAVAPEKVAFDVVLDQ